MKISVEELKGRLQYDPKTGNIYWREGQRLAGRRAFTHKGKRGYLVSNFKCNGKSTTISAHRAAWALHHGEWPTGQVDHINGDRTDNRIENLRDVVNAENARNSAMNSNNTSGVCGVYLHRQTGKWCAQISAFGKTVGLGLFADKSDAVIARKAAERVLGYHPNHGRAPTQDRIR